MANKNILIEKGVIKRKGGVVVLDLEKYKKLGEKIEEFERKEKLLKSLEKFESLAKWSRVFARKKRISQKMILEND